MRLEGGIYYSEDGLSQSIRAMHMQSELMGINAENVTGFDKTGYQRKEPVVSSFSEVIGTHGISTAIDDKVGRIMQTSYPLDVALAQKGYLQLMDKDGSIKLTRDGRIRIDKNGYLLGVEGQNLLGVGGEKLRLTTMPEKLEDIKISQEGTVNVYNPQTGKMENNGTISVVSSEGAIVTDPDIRQGYLEASNVSLEQEFFEMVPIRRNFTANYQMFLIQSNNLSRALQQLGGS
jgi:flagellar basal-body rod protein FlgF